MESLILLTHEKEINRKTGTGQIVKKVLGKICKIIKWSRVDPDRELVGNISNSILIYPGGDDLETINPASYNRIILLDGTWQEARKIYNKSKYLKDCRRATLNPVKESIYNLRRNQLSQGLCTAEAVALTLAILGDHLNSRKIMEELKSFLKC